MSKNKELKKIIGSVWGKQYGKFTSQEMATLKKVQREYDESVFHVSAESIAYKISKQREQTVLQDFGSKGIRFEWDAQILVFAKDMGVDPNFTSQVLLYLARDCLLDDINNPVASEDRSNILKKLQRQSKHESLTLEQRYAERCLPVIELIVFYKNLLELWQDDIKPVLNTVFFNPDLADELLRRNYVDREPFVDPQGIKHKQPDQPIVGRYTTQDEIRTYIGESNELYTARLIQIFMYSAYYPIYRQEWITEKGQKWIESKFLLNRWFESESLNIIDDEIDLAKQIMILKVYWDGLITQLRKSFYTKKDFRGLATETKRIIDVIHENPKTNIIFSIDLLKSKIKQNITNGIFIYFESTYKMKVSDLQDLYNENKAKFDSNFEELWQKKDFEGIFKFIWNLWSELRSNYSDKKKEELIVEWEYAKEQKRYIESFDTIQKKHFSKISALLRESSPETGIEVLDRTIGLITLELSEIALSGVEVSFFQKKKFEESLLLQLTSQIKFLLQFKEKFDISTASLNSSESQKLPTFDAELESSVGITIFNYINDWFSIIKDVFKTRDRFLRENLSTTEKYQLFLGIYERYVRSGIEMLQYFDRSEQVHVLESLQRINILDFAQYIVLASNTKRTIKEAYDNAAKYFETDPVKLDGQSKYFDVVMMLKLVEDNLVEDVAKTETSSELRGIIQLVDSNLDYQNRVELKDCEKIIRSFLEKQGVRQTQQYIQQFRDKVYEWNAVRFVEKEKFVAWLSKLDLNKSNLDVGQALVKDADNEIAIVYLDITGDRKGVGRESHKALDAGLFQAIRPGEIIRNFGLQLRNMEFSVHDPKFPVQWIWLNHLPIVGKEAHKLKVQESSLFINMKKEPNIRNLDSVHSLIHRILEGKERRNINSDKLFDAIIRDMINDVLIEEKTEAIRFFESQPKFGSEFNFSESTYIPYLLLNFELSHRNFKVNWETIELFAGEGSKPSREEFSTSGYPWVIDTSNRFRDVLIDMFNKRLEGSVDLSKASFLWPENDKIYFTIADVDPEKERARIIIFRSTGEEEKESGVETYNFVDIRRRLDLLLGLPPERLNFVKILETMNASDIQLIVDKLENL